MWLSKTSIREENQLLASVEERSVKCAKVLVTPFPACLAVIPAEAPD